MSAAVKKKIICLCTIFLLPEKKGNFDTFLSRKNLTGENLPGVQFRCICFSSGKNYLAIRVSEICYEEFCFQIVMK